MIIIRLRDSSLVKKWIIEATSILGMMFLLLCVILIVSSKINGGGSQLFGHQLVTILSGSMEPEIHRGSVVLVKSINDSTTLDEGDVITFHSPRDNSQLITHRIVEISGEGSNAEFITKGDANRTPDAKPLSADLVVAKYEGINIPYLGYIVEFMKSKWGLIFFLVIPAIYMVVSNVTCFRTFVNRSKS